MISLEQRFWAKVQKTDGCWLWTAATARGYGYIGKGRVLYSAHRVSWELHNGPIPEGRWVLHKCDTPLCVNPGHLFLGTSIDNVADMVAKRRHRFGDSYEDVKLTDQQVRDIRLRRGQTQRSLAKEYGVNQSSISRIRSGERRVYA